MSAEQQGTPSKSAAQQPTTIIVQVPNAPEKHGVLSTFAKVAIVLVIVVLEANGVHVAEVVKAVGHLFC